MPRDITSPFSPGKPVSAEFFVGRKAEIERLDRKIAKALDRGLEVGFVTGERGIGKSSLAWFIRTLAEQKSNVLGVHAFLGGARTLEDVVRSVFDRLLKDNYHSPWFNSIKDLFGKRIKEVGLFGVSVEFQAKEQDLASLVRGFAPALRNLVNKLRPEKKGLLIVLDDINGLASSPEFANWLKSLVDEIATYPEPLPVCLLLVGLDERRTSLIRSQPSLDRILDVVDIRAWSLKETESFFQNVFSRVGIEVDPDALTAMAHYAGGLPVLAHEIGDVAFNSVGKDFRITEGHALSAILEAADIIGRRYLEPQVLDAIQSRRYREILRILTKMPVPVRRSELMKRLDPTESKVLDNFLRRMLELGVLTRKQDEVAGTYTFVNRLHRLYFSMEAERIAPTRKSPNGADAREK